MPLSPKTYTLLCGMFVALGSMLFGYDLGIIAAVLPAPDFLRVTNYPNETYLGFITSSLLLGAFCGCIPASLIADKFSRKTAIFWGAILFLLGGSLQTGARNREMMLAGRFFAGMSIGMLSMLAPLYQSEIASPSIRGRLTTLQQFFLGIGAFIASWVGYGLTQGSYGTALQWRLALGLQMAPAVPLAAMIHLFPESPRWLMLKGRKEECLNALARLHARGDVTDALVVAEYEELESKVTEEARNEWGWMEMFRDASVMRRIMLGIFLQFSVQMTGVSVIQYYSPQIFAAIGFSTARTLLFQSINSVIALIGEFLCVVFVDKTGRRWPLIIANAVSGATFCVGTALQAIYPASTGNKQAGIAFVMMTWIFNFAFSAGIGPLSWAYPVEILNTATRAKGTALTSMAAWIANFMIAQVSPAAFAAVGWKYYVVFAICGFTNALTIYLFFPESKGRTLEEQDDFFRNAPLLVPRIKGQTVSATQRENELRQRVLNHPVGQTSQPIMDEEKGFTMQKEHAGSVL